ncbi:hypothetical protein LTR37_003412 [Vermiconidia calcicola]|uniref:Uncharacterized protein n=1 Tax=Vermiconidia calcicola TaxID=1690605 RepID=A0ACC3NRZ8_9PEZI|nr:hypothetical protein LTR37_003412 [Vermiconidia calcicola]
MSSASRIAGMNRALSAEEFQALGGQVWLTPKVHRTHTDPPAEYMHLLTEAGYIPEQHGSVVRLPDRDGQSYWTGESITSELDTSVAYHEAYFRKLAAGLSLGHEPNTRNPFSSAASTPAPASVASRARTMSAASASTRAATPKVSANQTTGAKNDKHQNVQDALPATPDAVRFKADVDLANGRSTRKKLKKMRQVGEEDRPMLESVSSDAINSTPKAAKTQNIVNLFSDGAIEIPKSIEHNIVDGAFKKMPDTNSIHRQTGMDIMIQARDVVKFGVEYVTSQEGRGEPLPDMSEGQSQRGTSRRRSLEAYVAGGIATLNKRVGKNEESMEGIKQKTKQLEERIDRYGATPGLDHHPASGVNHYGPYIVQQYF